MQAGAKFSCSGVPNPTALQGHDPLCTMECSLLQRDVFVSSIQINILPYFLLTARGVTLSRFFKKKKKKIRASDQHLSSPTYRTPSVTHSTHTMDTQRH